MRSGWNAQDKGGNPPDDTTVLGYVNMPVCQSRTIPFPYAGMRPPVVPAFFSIDH